MKKLKLSLICLLALLFVCIPNVNASSQIANRTEIKVDNKVVYKKYDNKATNETGIEGGTAGIVLVDANGKTHYGFCIDFGVMIIAGTNTADLTLYDYFRNVLSEEATNELIRKLNLYIHFGYGSAGRTTDNYYLATQDLIWDAINKTGFYNSDFYKERASKKFIIENFEWVIDTNTPVDIAAEKQEIEKSISEYYKKPSFCSSQNKIEIEVGETAEYIDNNSVLSKYTVNCENGIVCETNGNTLKVTAKEETGSYKISFKKSQQGAKNLVYRVGTSQGIIITDEGNLEEVSCQFGVDTFKNVQTADIQIIYIITIAVFCGIIAYIAYNTKKTLQNL